MWQRLAEYRHRHNLAVVRYIIDCGEAGVIKVEVRFSEDPVSQAVFFAVMPRIGEHILVALGEEIVPRPWKVVEVMHMIYSQSGPGVAIKVEPA